MDAYCLETSTLLEAQQRVLGKRDGFTFEVYYSGHSNVDTDFATMLAPDESLSWVRMKFSEDAGKSFPRLSYEFKLEILDWLVKHKVSSDQALAGSLIYGAEYSKEGELFQRAMIPYWQQQPTSRVIQNLEGFGTPIVSLNFTNPAEQLDLCKEKFKKISGQDWDDKFALSLADAVKIVAEKWKRWE